MTNIGRKCPARVLVPVAVALLAVAGMPSASEAYIDPGTGSYLFQIGIAFFLGSILAIKTYWHRLRELIRNLFARKDRDPAP